MFTVRKSTFFCQRAIVTAFPVSSCYFPSTSLRSLFHCCPAHPNRGVKKKENPPPWCWWVKWEVMLPKQWRSSESLMRILAVGGRSVEVWRLCHQKASSLLQPWHHCSIPFHRAGTTETPITLPIYVSRLPSLTHSLPRSSFTLTHIDQESSIRQSGFSLHPPSLRRGVDLTRFGSGT